MDRSTTAPKSQDRLKRLLPDGGTGALCLAECLSLNLNFSFLNRILLLHIEVAIQLSSRGWVDPVPDHILPEKFLEQALQPGIEPGTSWMAVRRANHYTKQVVILYCGLPYIPCYKMMDGGLSSWYRFINGSGCVILSYNETKNLKVFIY